MPLDKFRKPFQVSTVFVRLTVELRRSPGLALESSLTTHFPKVGRRCSPAPKALLPPATG